mgnify:CR=1 FL=1
MKLAAHEMHDLHELALSCVNSITNMALFLNQVQDQELRGIIERHFPYHIRDYNMKAEYLRNAEGAKTRLPVPELNDSLQNFTQFQTNHPPITPRTNVQKFDDREIATAYLLTLKRSGREYAWSAMEASNPEIREFLEHAFLMSSHHAYDVWQWMVKRGFYPLEEAPQNALNMLGSIYNVVPENINVLQ